MVFNRVARCTPPRTPMPKVKGIVKVAPRRNQNIIDHFKSQKKVQRSLSSAFESAKEAPASAGPARRRGGHYPPLLSPHGRSCSWRQEPSPSMMHEGFASVHTLSDPYIQRSSSGSSTAGSNAQGGTESASHHDHRSVVGMSAFFGGGGTSDLDRLSLRMTSLNLQHLRLVPLAGSNSPLRRGVSCPAMQAAAAGGAPCMPGFNNHHQHENRTSWQA